MTLNDSITEAKQRNEGEIFTTVIDGNKAI
jgi:hypothetical protein